MIRTIILFTILMLIWLVMSGHYTPLVTGLGVLSAAFATFIAKRAGALDEEGLPLHMVLRLPRYIFWLIKEILLSNIATAKIILTGKYSPKLFSVPYTQKTPAAIATYANSITLTPGTVTVSINQKQFLVHALSRALADDVKSNTMDQKVTALESAKARKGTP